MGFSQTKKITIFGFEIAKVEVKTEITEKSASKERRGESSSNGIMPIDPDLVLPILVGAVEKTTHLTPDSFSFEGGETLTVNGNIDAYSGVQGLKENFDFSGIIKITFGLASLVNAYDKQNMGASGVFLRHVTEIIKDNWEEQKVSSQ